MAYNFDKYGKMKIVVDTEEEKENLNPNIFKMGTKLYVVSTKKWYILDGNKQWQEYLFGGNNENQNNNTDNNLFIVNIVNNTADKTYQECLDALEEGKFILFKRKFTSNDDIWTTAIANYDNNDNSIKAAFPNVYEDGTKLKFIEYSENGLIASQIHLQQESVISTYNQNNVVISEASNNWIYECGTLSSLTITSIPAEGDFIIKFTSGSTATTTNFPNTMIFNEPFSAKTNTRYEILVSNGYALYAEWAG